MEPRIRLIICDEDRQLRGRLKELIGLENDFELVSELIHLDQIKHWKMFEKVDILIAGLDSIQPTSVKQIFPLFNRGRKLKVFILSDLMQGDLMLRAMYGGIKAFLPKSIGNEELVWAIRDIFRGGIWFQKRIGVNGTHFKNGKKYFRNGAPSGLTAQEIRIHEMVRQGLRNKEIAEKLHLSEKTVKCHVHNIFNKLKVTKRTQLMDYSLNSSEL